MTIIALLALFVSAGLLVHQRFRLRLDEAVLYGCLLAFFEVVVIIQAFGLPSALRPTLVWAATAGCVLIDLGIAFWRRPYYPSRRLWPIPRLLWLPLLAVLLTAGLRIFLAWAVPPDGWDSLGYHLPIVLRWMKQGNFDLSGMVGAQRYFAWNGELVATWLALLGKSLTYAKIVQVLSLPLLASIGSVLGRRLAGLRWSWACAIAFPSVPIVLIQSGMAYADALHAAFWLAAVAAAVGLARTGRIVHLWGFALAFGLCLGSKSTIYFLAPLFVPLAVALFRTPRRIRRPVVQAALCLTLVIISGSGTYVRNAVVSGGNPIFPYGLSVAGHTVFKGIVSTADMPTYMEHWFVPTRWGWIIYPFWEHIRSVFGYSHVNGFGPLFAVGWLFFPVALVLAWKRREALALAFLCLFPLVALLFFTLQPVQLPRYVIFAAPLPIVSLAYALRRARGSLRRAALWVWTIAIIVGCAGVFAFLFRAPGMRGAWHNLVSGRRPDAGEYYAKQYPAVGRAWQALNAKLEAGDVVVVNYNELILPWAGMPPRADVRVVVYGECIYPQVLHGRTEEEWFREVGRQSPRFIAIWSPGWNPGGEERLSLALIRRGEPYDLLGRWTSGDFGWVEVYQSRR